MKKIYMKNELLFSLLWIGFYVVLLSIAENLSDVLGTEKIITAPFTIIIATFLVLWITKNGLTEKYGFCKSKISCKELLYFIPLIIIGSVNLWHGVTLNYSIFESIIYVISMLCVGVIEEILFRGFLFQAMCRDNVKAAIIVSSLTFGIGHIVNLFNGAEIFSTLLQVCYAAAIGFMFTIIVYKGKTIIPCIITHSVVNSLSTFAIDAGAIFDTIVAIVLIVVSVLYAVWILKSTKNYGLSY